MGVPLSREFRELAGRVEQVDSLGGGTSRQSSNYRAVHTVSWQAFHLPLRRTYSMSVVPDAWEGKHQHTRAVAAPDMTNDTSRYARLAAYYDATNLSEKIEASVSSTTCTPERRALMVGEQATALPPRRS